MNQNFKRYLDDRKIVSVSYAKNLVGKEMEAALEDLDNATFGFKHQRYKWCIIQSYYCMFHAARALIYSCGYREKSHHCLSVALKALFVETGKMERSLADIFDSAMSLRENADYHSRFSEKRAKATIASAEKFLHKAREILG